MEMLLVLLMAAWFGFTATDRWLSLPPAAITEHDAEVVILSAVVIAVTLSVRVVLG
jgi:hypothetical protein